MSRVTSRLLFALCLALLFLAQTRLNAATTAPSTETFLATLSDQAPCGATASNGDAPVDIALQAPDPALRVLYPDCGVFCSEYQCSGGYYQESCTTATDKPGRCVPRNVVCPNEPMHSPCTCLAW